jgi:L-ascorbate metabolism protein UlaG (beta-lactamase superfamily)
MVRLTYIGGPTALVELGGVRLLTDPTFDPAGTEYQPFCPSPSALWMRCYSVMTIISTIWTMPDA